jgi:hypothetical protein
MARMIGFVETLALEPRDDRVGVNAIAPVL